jgi:hypothetical protein
MTTHETKSGTLYVRQNTGAIITDASGNGVLINQASGTTHQLGFSGTTTTLRMVPVLELAGNMTCQVDKTPNLGAEAARINTVTAQTLSTKTHDAFTGSQSFRQTGAVQVTNALANTVATIAVPDNSCMWLEASVIVRDTASANRAAYVRQACVYRQGGGGATILTGVLGPATVETAGVAAAWDATISVSGNNALVTFQNTAGALTLNVATTVRYQSVIGNT